MRISGLSVTEAIREIVTRNRSIYDCMKMDIINYTALAVKIQPNVERQIGKSVNLNTIVVAIKRYADSFEQKKDLHDETLLKNARLSLTESMMDINLEHDAAGSDLTDLLEKFTQITQNYDLIKIPGSFRILTEDMESVRKLLESIPNVMDLSNNRLVRIKITVSEESRADVGSSVIGLLHGNGIEFVDAYFSQENMIITFNREDASRAYDVCTIMEFNHFIDIIWNRYIIFFRITFCFDVYNVAIYDYMYVLFFNSWHLCNQFQLFVCFIHYGIH